MVFLSSSLQAQPFTLSHSPFTESLISLDHTSEGFMVRTPTGAIHHYFRLLPYESKGGHIGNDGRVVRRISNDNGLSWSEYEVIYDDTLDDRNVHVGITGSNGIVICFRRYDASLTDETLRAIDINILSSTDQGLNWSLRTIIPSAPLPGAGTQRLVNIPGGISLLGLRGYYYTEFRKLDNRAWGNYGGQLDYLSDSSFYTGEGCFAYAGNGMIFGLLVDMSRGDTSSYYQVYSKDYGMSWSTPQRTNITPGYFCVSPHIFYDEAINRLIILASDRRSTNAGESALKECLWIYSALPEELMQDPRSYTLVDTLPRPEKGSWRFYGYPCAVKTDDGRYLVVVSDGLKTTDYKNGGTENANLYQFWISIDKQDTTSPGAPVNGSSLTSLDSCTLKWENIDPDPDFSGYIIRKTWYVQNQPASEFLGRTMKDSYTVGKNLLDGDSVIFEISSADSSGNESPGLKIKIENITRAINEKNASIKRKSTARIEDIYNIMGRKVDRKKHQIIKLKNNKVQL